jgi:hypothetical protein
MMLKSIKFGLHLSKDPIFMFEITFSKGNVLANVNIYVSIPKPGV